MSEEDASEPKRSTRNNLNVALGNKVRKELVRRGRKRSLDQTST